MSQYVILHVNQDWMSEPWPKEGTVFIYRGQDYNVDKMLTTVILEEIGLPSPRNLPTEIRFNKT